MVEKLLAQYGMDIAVEDQHIRGLLQPVTGKLERLALVQPGPLGEESRQRYIYIGPLKPQLRQEMVLTARGNAYVVRSAHEIRGQDGPLYSWAMCVEKGRDASWGMSC